MNSIHHLDMYIVQPYNSCKAVHHLYMYIVQAYKSSTAGLLMKKLYTAMYMSK